VHPASKERERERERETMENEANVSHLSTSEVLDAADEFSREVEGDEELQVPLAEEEEDAEEGENEEYAVKPQPPVFSRLASGVRKSLTNLFSFGLFSGSTEGNEKEEQGEASAANGQEPEDMEEELAELKPKLRLRRRSKRLWR